MKGLGRPKLHFTPPKGWMNDPNGLVYVDGIYHLFYQYHPFSTVWGPMHWGHAISRDLIHWIHLPIALEPDELGFIFSGSAVYDKDNTSGFGDEKKRPIVTIFTHHSNLGERQSVAWSLDYINFTKYIYNPIIENPGIRDFRDPKVFWYREKSCWCMVISAGDRVHFYRSNNLKSWDKTGEFGPEGNYAPGVWECPDLFPLKTSRGEEKWILIVSMGMSVDLGGSRTQYFIGNFDGERFICTEPARRIEWIDQGPDCYAGNTFNNIPDDRRIFIAWNMNWIYADKVPNNGYRGVMGFPRVLSLIETPIGLKLACDFIDALNRLKKEELVIQKSLELNTDTFYIEGVTDGRFTIQFVNDKDEVLTFGIDENNRFFVDRREAGISDFSEYFPNIYYAQRIFTDRCRFKALWDVYTLEILADNGTINMSVNAFPSKMYTRIVTEGNIDGKFYTLENIQRL
ncbi:MAG: glycoside hydrolase family 32 protein [bacterium]|nr:glycoside hydrolase family 32 protein [bacterium]